MTTDQIIAYYRDLLIVQYAAQPRARQTVQAYVAACVADQIIAQVRDAFNFSAGDLGGDVATGAQLETLASYRGLQRQVYGIERDTAYFAMPEYGDADADTTPGLRSYGQTTPVAFITYALAAQPLYAMTDSELARLVQLRALSQRRLSVKEVDDILYAVFKDRVGVFENSAMDITYVGLTDDTDTLFDIATLTKSWPRPAGVAWATDRLPAIAGEWGYQIYGEAIDPAFVGFGLYGSPQLGSFMRYF